MSLLTDASLVLVPSAYKTGEVLVQKPLPTRFADETGNYDGNDPTTNANLTFTRTGDTATRVNADGLVEKVRTNLLLQSNQFDTTWASSSTTETAGQSGYDGTSDAWLLDKSASGGNVNQNISVSGINTFSVYVKAGTDSWVALLVAGPNSGKYFNLSGAGAVGSNFVNAPVGASIESIGSGWFRISMVVNGSITQVRIYPADGDGDTSGTSGSIYIQNAQLEAGDIATAYIPTTTAAVSVGPVANLPRIDYTGGGCGKLLLEPQRTNLFKYSEQLDNSAWLKSASGSAASPVVTANYAISPDGYQNADRVYFNTVGTASTDRSGLVQQFAFTAGQVYTISVYAKSATGTNQVLQLRVAGAQAGGEKTVTNEWQRFTETFTATATITDDFGAQLRGINSTTTSDLLLWGFQIEQNASYASSYVNTLSAAVTRGADAAYKTGISSLIGQTEGTMYFEFNGGANDSLDYGISLSDGTTNNRIIIYRSSTNTLITNIRTAASTVAQISTSTLTANTTHKVAVGYANNDVVFYVNGTQIGTDTIAVIPATDRIVFDNGAGSGAQFYRPLDQLLLFKTRLSNADLQTLTTL